MITLNCLLKKYNTVGLKLFGLWLCNVGCASTLHVAFHYVLKITNRGYIDPKGIGHIHIYIYIYIKKYREICMRIHTSVHVAVIIAAMYEAM